MLLKPRSFAWLAIVAISSLLLAGCSLGTSNSARTSTTTDAQGSTDTTNQNRPNQNRSNQNRSNQNRSNQNRSNQNRSNQNRPNRNRPNQLTANSLSGIACPETGATETGTKALARRGTQTNYTTGDDYLTVISDCTTALEAAGWTVVDGEGGDYVGGGLRGTKGVAHVQVEARDNDSNTKVHVCYWPGPQSDDNCGGNDQDNNDNDQDNNDNDQDNNDNDQDNNSDNGQDNNSDNGN